MNNIKRKKKKKEKLSNSEFSISKAKNINFFFFSQCNEFANLDNPSIDRGKKKKKSWRVATPDTISLFSFDVAPLYTRRIKIEIDRCDRQCLNSLKKIRVTRRGNWKSQFVRFPGEKDRGGECEIREVN